MYLLAIHVLFGIISIHILYLFFDLVACLLIIELYVFYVDSGFSIWSLLKIVLVFTFKSMIMLS